MTVQDKTIDSAQRTEMPSESGPLGAYGGQRPPAPEWFDAALSTRYETHMLERDGAKVHYQSWGDPSKPGLLLTHGNGAHAHWWDFIAPYFLQDYHVVAVTLSGMGDSGWRETYSMETFEADQMAVAEAAGLFAHAEKPILVSHSFGGFVTMYTCRRHSERFKGVVIVDSPVLPPDREHHGPPRRDRQHKLYPSLTDALARFRLAPPQPCDNHYAMDYIARHSLKETAREDGGSDWVWKFDPSIWGRFDTGDMPPHEMLKSIGCPLAIMRGADSAILQDDIWDYMQELCGENVPAISIPHAHHHVMLDQPIAFVSALRSLLAAWKA